LIEKGEQLKGVYLVGGTVGKSSRFFWKKEKEKKKTVGSVFFWGGWGTVPFKFIRRRKGNGA